MAVRRIRRFARKALFDRTPASHRGFGAGEGYVVPPGMISLHDMLAAIIDRLGLSDETPQVRKQLRNQPAHDVVQLLRDAASRGQFTIQWQDGMAPPLWYWSTPAGESTIKVGVFFSTNNNEAWQPYQFEPMFTGREEFHHWLRGLKMITGDPAGTQPTGSVQNLQASASGAGESTREETQSADKDAKLRNRIQQVQAAARRVCDEKRRAVELAAIAKELAGTASFRSETIRQILNGTYPPAQRLRLGKFVWQRRKRRPESSA